MIKRFIRVSLELLFSILALILCFMNVFFAVNHSEIVSIWTTLLIFIMAFGSVCVLDWTLDDLYNGRL